MAEEVVIGSMQAIVEVAEGGAIGEVLSLFRNQMNDGKVVVIVEGPDDKEVYQNVMDANAVCFYVDCNCEKHFVVLNALNGRYGNRLLAIKDADFDRLEGTANPYPNMVLTDTHDMEGMIVNVCLSELQGEDARRCQDIILSEVYEELEDVSYLKWFNHVNHYGINFRETTLDLDINAYFNACVMKTNNVVNVNLNDMYAFKAAHPGVSQKELCNGHDLFERIFVRAKAADVANFAKKPFFRRLRQSYPKDMFVNTALFLAIKAWEVSNNHAILAVVL